MGQRKTIQSFQWMRALGALGIVVLHAISTAQNTGAYDISDVERLRDGIICIVCGRWCVPVFFMMSGALLLDPKREMGWPKLLRHVWRLAFVLLTFGLGFCLIESFVDYGGFSLPMVGDAVMHLLTGSSWDHLWFVYQLLGFYLVTPLIRPWFAQASREELRNVTLVVCILLLGLNTISALIPDGVLYYGFEVPHCFAYYFMGYYVYRYVNLNGRWRALGIASLVATIVLWRLFWFAWATDPNRIVIAPYALLVLLVAKRYLEIPTDRVPFVSLLADYSFGVYIIHPLFQHLLVRIPSFTSLPLPLASTILLVGSLALSIPTIWLLRRIPCFSDKI